MKKYILPIIGLMTLQSAWIISSCNDDDPAGNPNNPDAGSINAYFSSMPEWDNSEPAEVPDEPVDGDFRLIESNIPYLCPTVKDNLVKSFDKIIAVGTNNGKIWPGALIEGNSLSTGDLKLINIGRAPMTINVDLPITTTFREIEEPNSVSVQQAISEMQVEAGDLEEGSQAGAGVMHFEVSEASSFEQSMLSLGVSGGFTEPQSQVGIEASTNVSHERSVKTHTVVAKFFQEKFTVRIADDLIPEPVDFFSKSVRLEDLQALDDEGIIGVDNIPIYIESVTYGRIMLFSMKSTDVENSNELSAALKASMSDYVNGEATITDRQRTIIRTSQTTIFVAGGSEEGANKAIAGLNWSSFFEPTSVSQTVPVAFTVRTMNGKQQVKLIESIFFEKRQNCQAPTSYDIKVTMNKAELKSGVCLACVYSAKIKSDGAILNDPIAAGTIHGVWNGPEIGSGEMSLNGSEIGSSVEVLSGYCTAGWSPAGCVFQQYANLKTTAYNWPYTKLTVGNTQLTHTISEAFRTFEFSYTIRKVANY